MIIIRILKILPMFVLLFLLVSGLKQCQQNICDSDPMMCDQPLERIMKSLGFYFVAFFFLYLMCIFTLGVAGESSFLLQFSIIYLISIVVCYPFFEMVRRKF